MQGLVNFATAIGDAIVGSLPAACYLMACSSFFYFAWTLWTWSSPHAQSHHLRHTKPWLPFVSLALAGVFATFPAWLTRFNVTMGTSVVAGLTDYSSSTPMTATAITGATPADTLLAVITLFQYFFQAFGAGCVLWAIIRFRGISLGQIQGSPLSCGIQLLFGAMLINILTVAGGVVALFS